MKKTTTKTKPVADPALITGIGARLEESRRAVVRAANCFMTATYWEVGRRIVEFEQGGKQRAEYGEELIERLARDLTERHGRGFSRQNVWNMRQFFIAFSSPKILQTVSGEFADTGEIGASDTRKRYSAKILQTVSGESGTGIAADAEPISQTLSAKSLAPISATLSRNLPDDTLSLLRTLATRFPLPWSHYVKLLTVKDENARRFYEDEALPDDKHAHLRGIRRSGPSGPESPQIQRCNRCKLR